MKPLLLFNIEAKNALSPLSRASDRDARQPPFYGCASPTRRKSCAGNGSTKTVTVFADGLTPNHSKISNCYKVLAPYFLGLPWLQSLYLMEFVDQLVAGAHHFVSHVMGGVSDPNGEVSHISVSLSQYGGTLNLKNIGPILLRTKLTKSPFSVLKPMLFVDELP